MHKRHQSNTNLRLHHDQYWNGLQIQTQHGPMIDHYLQRIHETMMRSLSHYPRTCVIMFTLTMPSYWDDSDTSVISRFFESLKAQIHADQSRKQSDGKRVHETRVRYCWVKERDTSLNSHYHVAILVNRDAYFTLGELRESHSDAWLDVPQDPLTMRQTNMAGRIQEAWCSALGLPSHSTAGLVHYSDKHRLSIDRNSDEYCQEFGNAFYSLSYWAKADTKHYDGGRSFGCSQR